MTHLKPAESALTVKKCEAMKATNVVILWATTQNLEAMGSVRIELQTSAAADTITQPQKTIGNYKYLQQKIIYQ